MNKKIIMISAKSEIEKDSFIRGVSRYVSTVSALNNYGLQLPSLALSSKEIITKFMASSNYLLFLDISRAPEVTNYIEELDIKTLIIGALREEPRKYDYKIKRGTPRELSIQALYFVSSLRDNKLVLKTFMK
ncbi:MAG: hypothetical protein RSA91_05615 [Bacilli bacterium]